jgi:hypothetical protein
MKSQKHRWSTVFQYRLLSKLMLNSLFIAGGLVFSLSTAVAQDTQEVSQAEIDKYHDIKQAAKSAKVEDNVQEDATGTDPRVFSDKFMPYYRYTELENGVIQQDVTVNGTLDFNPRVGVFYEVPVAQYRDFSGIEGADPDADAIGMGDIDLKFLWRPKATDWKYGKDKKMSGSLLFGTDFLLPTATDDLLGGNSFLFGPIVGIVVDMPLHGFFAALNIYYIDVYKDSTAGDTSLYVGKWFYMQPLTKPGEWWGGIFLLPEFQPIYDFETDDFSAWIGVELGKMLAPGKIAYIKPGWGLDNSEEMDRKSTVEAGVRWFF